MSDNWLAPDKLQHFLACGVVSALSWRALWRARSRPRRRAALAFAAGLAVGLAKEVLDAAGVRTSQLLASRCLTPPERVALAGRWRLVPPRPVGVSVAPLIELTNKRLRARASQADALGSLAAASACVAVRTREPLPAAAADERV